MLFGLLFDGLEKQSNAILGFCPATPHPTPGGGSRLVFTSLFYFTEGFRGGAFLPKLDRLTGNESRLHGLLLLAFVFVKDAVGALN